MELDRWQIPGDMFEGVQGNIEALMPLKSTWIENDLSAVLTESWNAPEELRIDVIDKDRATPVQSRSLSVFVEPEMFGNDHTVCKRR